MTGKPAHYYKDKVQYGWWTPVPVSDKEALESFKRVTAKEEALKGYELDSYTIIRRPYLSYEECTAVKGWFKRRSENGSSKEGGNKEGSDQAGP